MCLLQYTDSSRVFRSKKASLSQLGYLQVAIGRSGDLERFFTRGGGLCTSDCSIHAWSGVGRTSRGGGVTFWKRIEAGKESRVTATGSEVASSSESELREDSWLPTWNAGAATDDFGTVIDDLSCLPGGWPHLSHFMPPVDVPA